MVGRGMSCNVLMSWVPTQRTVLCCCLLLRIPRGRFSDVLLSWVSRVMFAAVFCHGYPQGSVELSGMSCTGLLSEVPKMMCCALLHGPEEYHVLSFCHGRHLNVCAVLPSWLPVVMQRVTYWKWCWDTRGKSYRERCFMKTSGGENVMSRSLGLWCHEVYINRVNLIH
jgi:hypothetical protein